MAAACNICNMPLPQRESHSPLPFTPISAPPPHPPPPSSPPRWPLLMPSNDIEGPITRCDAVWRCCRLSSAAVFHFLAKSWMPANCFLCAPPSFPFPPPASPPLSPSRFFHSFRLNEAALFVCLFRPQAKRKKVLLLIIFICSFTHASLSLFRSRCRYVLSGSIDKR